MGSRGARGAGSHQGLPRESVEQRDRDGGGQQDGPVGMEAAVVSDGLG